MNIEFYKVRNKKLVDKVQELKQENARLLRDNLTLNAKYMEAYESKIEQSRKVKSVIALFKRALDDAEQIFNGTVQNDGSLINVNLRPQSLDLVNKSQDTPLNSASSTTELFVAAERQIDNSLNPNGLDIAVEKSSYTDVDEAEQVFNGHNGSVQNNRLFINDNPRRRPHIVVTESQDRSLNSNRSVESQTTPVEWCSHTDVNNAEQILNDHNGSIQNDRIIINESLNPYGFHKFAQRSSHIDAEKDTVVALSRLNLQELQNTHTGERNIECSSLTINKNFSSNIVHSSTPKIAFLKENNEPTVENVNASSETFTTERSRRARSQKSYAEPKLNQKMRRDSGKTPLNSKNHRKKEGKI